MHAPSTNSRNGRTTSRRSGATGCGRRRWGRILRWWQLTDPCQEQTAGAVPGEWWTPMREVFHHD
ncbi:L-rhamnose mutarotase [Streptomyces sp. MS1.AVA.3]|uniref:L-rhamnose mutarotase n=1 Tax=Streptomyces decoyicus TaxID=249567 RepID=UPI0030C0B225